jgi:hypothetical protein
MGATRNLAARTCDGEMCFNEISSFRTLVPYGASTNQYPKNARLRRAFCDRLKLKLKLRQRGHT